MHPSDDFRNRQSAITAGAGNASIQQQQNAAEILMTTTGTQIAYNNNDEVFSNKVYGSEICCGVVET